ncbi:hypothetical protein B0T11DRAFT_355953 [Plectosphaerella cucumerina]|uniref:F-box domain-containing protein n=1 Tax=Plectosphaerella cucumerina TaxID=40658 RepID=A0A8K0TAK7_9PEZI|nr:hypothetical protein B0T11DRAFT_355953 [Plectosphaerella cucumerina]
MDRLSPEIICMIFDHLGYKYYESAYKCRYGLRTNQMYSTLAVVSRTWQHIIERKLFRHIRLRDTIDEVSQFGAIYSQPRRQATLQRLELLATLDLDLFPTAHHTQAHLYLFRVRKALIRVLHDAKTGLPHLRRLKISMGVDEPRNNQFECSDLRDEDGVDELCDAIRFLSLAVPLRELHLDRVYVSLALFQDCRLTDKEPDSTPWPLLEDFQVSFPPMAPSGMWYTKGNPETYTGPSGSEPFSDEEQETSRGNIFHPTVDFQYRNTINPVTFNPLQAAFARAVLRMPALRFGALSMYKVSGDALGVGMMDRSMTYDISQRGYKSPAWIEENKKAAEADAALKQKSACKSLNRKTMFRRRPLWVPTPEITDLWMEWTMGI